MQLNLNLGEVLDANDLAYGSGLRDAISWDAGGRTFVLMVNGSGGGLTSLEVLSNGTLSLVDETLLLGTFQPGIEPRLTVFDDGGGVSLLISGQSTTAGRSVALSSDGTFGSSGVVTGDPGSLIQPSAIDGPDGTYLIGGSDSGLVSYAVGPGPSLAEVATLADTTGTYLSDVVDTSVITVDGTDYLLAVSAADAALTTIAVGTGGGLSVVGDVGAPDGLGLTNPTAVETLDLDGRAFAVVAGSGSGSLSVVEVLAGGVPVVRDHVVDDLSTRFDGVEALATLDVAGRGFVAAGGADDGVSLFVMAPNGRLVHLSSFEDTVSTTLDGVSALALADTGSSIEVIAAGLGDDGVTRLTADISTLGLSLAASDAGGSLTGGALDDILVGGMAADTLEGAAGADILIDGGGSDTLTGGAGADLFVFDADGQTDVVTDFEIGVDRLDLSAFALLYDPAQLTAQTQSWGARLTWKDEVIDLYSSGGGGIDLSGWTASDIINVDRPQFLPIEQLLEGDGADNTLRGGEGDDTIRGFGGVDTLDGEGGADLIEAGSGNDFVTGGTGDDALFGEAGFDDIRGGAGADEIHGGNEADTLHGDDGDDLIFGEVGVDNIFGGRGADEAYGGSENDRLWGGDGDDRLDGGTQEDRLWGEAGNDTLFGGAGFDRLEGGAGEDTLWGGNQADNLLGQNDNDVLYGEGGFDRLFGGSGDDTGYGGTGPDSLFGEVGNDTLYGQEDDDRIFGGTGNDAIFGGEGSDDLWGGAGFDTINGGVGDDTLEGNFNADTFVFATGDGQDTITDFEATNDFERIDLSGVGSIADFADLAANHLADVSGNAVIDAGGGDVIMLQGVDVADLDSFDFLF